MQDFSQENSTTAAMPIAFLGTGGSIFAIFFAFSCSCYKADEKHQH